MASVMSENQIKGNKMSWNLDGLSVVGVYMGEEVSGVVESSRVKYGGTVQHTVNLNKPVQLRWRTQPTTRVLLDDNEIVLVMN
jgi:hypothetical protein